MLKKHARKVASFLGMALLFALFLPKLALADDNDDPPSVVARLAYTQGSVSFQPGGTDDWVGAVLNRPVTTGDKLWSDSDGRVELQLDASTIRLSNNTGFSFLNLDDNITQIRLTEGSVLVRVRHLENNETYEVDTPNLAFSITAPGTYRVTVDENGDSTAIKVHDGDGQVTGGGASYSVRANDDAVFSGTDQLSADVQDASGDNDEFDTWSVSRDQHHQRSTSAQYVSQDVVGYEDLDDHGDWRNTQEYGHVWYPRVEQTDWAPYHYGHWAYIEPWGYTWVDNESWGFAPFHYGRWVSVEGRWGWIPAPRRVEGVAYVRPVYAPALVAFVGGGGFSVGVSGGGGGGAVGWFALGPREVYVPSYRVSPRYVERVNVSNTTVNRTVVNNYYNTTVVNNTRVTNVTYVNQRVPGAVAATNREAFSSGQAVSRNTVKIDQRQMASAQVEVRQPTIVPTRQAVLGPGRPAAKQPPTALQARAVVAKAPPPPPQPSFERRQEAIKSNGGKPLTRAEIRQIQPAPAAQARATVRVAPPVSQPVVSVRQAPKPAQAPNRTPAQGVQGNVGNRPGQPGQPQNANPANRPATAPNAVQPNAAQPGNRPAERPAVTPNPAQPGNRPNERPNDRPGTQPNAAQPGNRPADRPAATPNAAQPGNRPNERPNDRPVTQPNAAQPGNRPSDRPNTAQPNRNERPADRATERPAPTPKPTDRPADRSAERPNAVQPNRNERPAPVPKPAERPTERPAAKPAERPAPAPKPTERPAERPAARPAERPAPSERPATRQQEREKDKPPKEKDTEKPPKDKEKDKPRG